MGCRMAVNRHDQDGDTETTSKFTKDAETNGGPERVPDTTSDTTNLVSLYLTKCWLK